MLTTLSHFSPIDRADLSPATKKQYKKALQRLQDAKVSPFNYPALASYSASLPPSSRAFLKSALRLMLSDIMTQAQASATVHNLDDVQVLWHRVQAIGKAIITHQPDAERTPHWLTQSQVDEITAIAYRASLRDYIVLALLFNGLLRRDELSNLTYENIKQIDGQSVIVLRGKGDKKRIMPLPDNIIHHLNEWKKQTGDGRIARSVHKTGKIGSSLSVIGIFDIVRKYGALIGISDLDPHDARRTGARIMYFAEKDILKVQNILGHSDTKTTLKYIGVEIDLNPISIVK